MAPPPAVSVTVFAKNGKVYCDSLEVANAFGKKHEHVLRDIRSLDCSAAFRKSNFGFREEIQAHSTGATKRKIAEMARDGFMFLVMGYPGEAAARAKEAFIAEFNRMEEEQRARRLTVRENSKKVRSNYTKTLSKHGVDRPQDYARATNSIYRGLWDKDAAALRQTHDLPAKCNVRDHMSETGLAAAMLAEALSSDRIVQTDRQGIDQCADASYQCATHVRGAISAERASRRVIGSPE